MFVDKILLVASNNFIANFTEYFIVGGIFELIWILQPLQVAFCLKVALTFGILARFGKDCFLLFCYMVLFATNSSLTIIIEAWKLERYGVCKQYAHCSLVCL